MLTTSVDFGRTVLTRCREKRNEAKSPVPVPPSPQSQPEARAYGGIITLLRDTICRKQDRRVYCNSSLQRDPLFFPGAIVSRDSCRTFKCSCGRAGERVYLALSLGMGRPSSEPGHSGDARLRDGLDLGLGFGFRLRLPLTDLVDLDAVQGRNDGGDGMLIPHVGREDGHGLRRRSQSHVRSAVAMRVDAGGRKGGVSVSWIEAISQEHTE
jgi:hypothetical protein